MAHLRPHDNSKYWYVRFRDLNTGKWREESTRLLRDDQQQTRAAQRIADKKTQDENRIGSAARGAFREWVRPYIDSHYTRESTRRRALHYWERLAEWLNKESIRHPREVRYEHAKQYLAWRKGQGIAHNTSLMELHFLAFLLNEAIRLEHAERNVMARLGIGREAAGIKPELSDDQIESARKAFLNRGWMRVACEMQIFVGCRISETSVDLADVDFDKEQITITDAKRKLTDKKKRYTVPLDPLLAATLRNIKGDRTVPIVTRGMEARYNEVLKAATGGATSHSFRVTFITRLRDAGVEERDAMELVNHSRKEVHAIYARTDTNRLRPARARLKFQPPLSQ